MDAYDRAEMQRLLVSKYSFPQARLVVEQCLASGHVNQSALKREGVTAHQAQEILSSMRFTFGQFWQ